MVRVKQTPKMQSLKWFKSTVLIDVIYIDVYLFRAQLT